MKKTIHYFFLFLFTLPFYSQVQPYYEGVNLSTTRNVLLTELSNRLSATHSGIPYTGSPVDVWDACKIADEDPDNAANVLLIYGFDNTDGDATTDRTRNKSLQDTGGTTGTWNREHVFAKSLALPGFGTGEPGPGTDVHNLRPADTQRNTSRSNRKFTDGSGNSGIVSANGGWYPGDEWKGDVARIIMYMYVRYHGDGSKVSETSCLPKNIGFGTVNSFDSNMIDLFLQWNVDDPVNPFEAKRNDELAGIQLNRNPFIDNPYLATLIWGGLAAEDKWNIGGSTDTEVPTVPVNLLASNETDESFDLSWTASTDNEVVYDYLIYLDGVLKQSSTTTTTTITNLAPETTYVVTIKARDISANLSDPSNALNITTLVGPKILLFEDFEDCANSKFFTYSEASNKDWICSSEYGEDGSNSTSMNGYQEDVPSKDWLITTNPINFDIDTGQELSFYAGAAYGSSLLELVYSSDYVKGSNPSGITWVSVPNITIPIKSNTTGSTQIFTFNDVDISAITGTVYFAFKYYSNGVPTRWMIDNFEITAAINEDIDEDGVLNVDDNCPTTANPDQADADGDGIGDVCDVCEGSDDSLDADNDGIPDGCDICTGFDDNIDTDNDGIPNGCDNCPTTANPAQVDTDGDGIGDVCDVCEGSDDSLDADNDGIPDGCDICTGFDDKVDTDNDGIPNGCDNCPTTANPAQVDTDGDGIGDVCDSTPNGDNDQDGVDNAIDKCPNTTTGLTVDANGCFTLAYNNFNFETISETCLGKNNGQLKITAQAAYSYKATINGTEYNFTNNSLTVDSLQPKIYTVCISITGETYKQCYEVTINAGTTVSGKSSQSSKAISFTMESGTPPYSIFLNDQEVLNTNEAKFSIENIKQGDKLQVKTAVICEGVLLKTIDLFDSIYAYPNPTKGSFEIGLSETNEDVFVELYNMQSQLVLSKNYKVQNGKIQLNIEEHPTGIYIVKIILNKQALILKLIKE